MKLNSPEILIPISILLVTSGVILGINLNNQNTTTTTAPPAPAEPSAPAVTVNPNFPISPYPTNVAVSFRDPVQVTDAPIQPPLKYNPYGPPPPQIATRGHPGNFQQVGILTGSKPGETGEPLILPLQGRHLHNRSDRWEYYVASGGFNQMRMPLKKGGRECMDSPGCEEIQSGDTLNLDGQSTDFKVTVYQNDQPRYYPDVL